MVNLLPNASRKNKTQDFLDVKEVLLKSRAQTGRPV
jgi:hypothetical protein